MSSVGYLLYAEGRRYIFLSYTENRNCIEKRRGFSRKSNLCAQSRRPSNTATRIEWPLSLSLSLSHFLSLSLSLCLSLSLSFSLSLSVSLSHFLTFFLSLSHRLAIAGNGLCSPGDAWIQVYVVQLP